jgi:hypothetical protein
MQHIHGIGNKSGITEIVKKEKGIHLPCSLAAVLGLGTVLAQGSGKEKIHSS